MMFKALFDLCVFALYPFYYFNSMQWFKMPRYYTEFNKSKKIYYCRNENTNWVRIRLYKSINIFLSLLLYIQQLNSIVRLHIDYRNVDTTSIYIRYIIVKLLIHCNPDNYLFLHAYNTTIYWNFTRRNVLFFTLLTNFAFLNIKKKNRKIN